ncbi:MAG: flavodoxin domain-containing protein [Nitrososphaeria archaeon]
MKALIVYGTRYGATADTSVEISKVLGEQNFEVTVANAKEDEIDDLSEYELVLVGSGISMSKWTEEAERFIKKHKGELANKKVALFVSSGSWPIFMKEGKTDECENLYRRQLLEKALKYSLNPIAVGLFGGIWNSKRMGLLARKTLSGLKPKLEALGFQQKDGMYDIRDMNVIREWAKEVAWKAYNT